MEILVYITRVFAHLSTGKYPQSTEISRKRTSGCASQAKRRLFT
jgi:hypothetical protein